MSCCNNGKTTKKKVIVFSLLGTGILATSYFVFTATNIAAAASLSAILGLAACPAMCAIMGGGMWIASRFTNRQNQKIHSEKGITGEQSWCSQHVHEHHKEDLKNSIIKSSVVNDHNRWQSTNK